MLTQLTTTFAGFDAKGKVICIVFGSVGCCLGLILPFVSHITLGRIFLPVDESLWETPQEDLIVRNVFVFCGFASVLMPAVAAVVLIIPKRLSTFCTALALAGAAIGALATMIYLSPGGWLFITRP